jgi:hypothetical protein
MGFANDFEGLPTLAEKTKAQRIEELERRLLALEKKSYHVHQLWLSHLADDLRQKYEALITP